MNITDLDTEKAATSFQAYKAWEDASRRSNQAREDNPMFFDLDHDDLVAKVKDIADKFFTVKKAIYITHRKGTLQSGPFTVVKIHNPTWQPGMQNRKQVDFYDKLTDLGIKEVKNSTQGMSIIVK